MNEKKVLTLNGYLNDLKNIAQKCLPATYQEQLSKLLEYILLFHKDSSGKLIQT